MIRLERAGEEDLEDVIAIQRASFKAVYEKYRWWIWPLSRTWYESSEVVESVPAAEYYFVKRKRRKVVFEFIPMKS